MIIAVFYSGYLPGEKYGGPVTSIYNFTELLGDSNDIYIICKDHDLNDHTPYPGINPGWNETGKAKVMYLSDKDYGKNSFSKILDDIKPDVVYVSSIFSAKQTYPLLSLSNRRRIPLLLAPRGELNNQALTIRAGKKRVYLRFLKALNKLSSAFFQATSEEERQSIFRELSVDSNRVFLLPNVPTLPHRKESIEKKANQLKMCSVGRIVENKNLIIALNAVVSSSAWIQFDIFGPIEDEEYWEKCQSVISLAPENTRINYKGVFSPNKMRDEYSKYDCLISPTEFENYGQSIVEAMLHDVPVIISEGTTPWDDISDFEAGFTIPLQDKSGFLQAIDALSAMDSEQYQLLIKRLRDYCNKEFNHIELKNRYQSALREIVVKEKKDESL